MAVHEVVPSSSQEAPGDPEEALLRLRDFLEVSDTRGAVAYLRELAGRWPDSERVRHYLNVLDPGPARVLHGQRSRSFDGERAWIKAHAHEHPGRWIALYGEELLASEPTLVAVREILRQMPGREDALVFFVPGTDWW